MLCHWEWRHAVGGFVFLQRPAFLYFDDDEVPCAFS